MTKLLEISLPRPHPRQAEIEACTAKRIVIRAGRRGGKTTMAARKAIIAAGAGRRVLYTAPIVEQTDAFWTKCTDWLSAAFLTKLIDKNETRRLLDFKHSGGRITARTAFKPDHLRGDYGDLILFDEYAFQDPEVWEKVGAPMTLDNDGDAWFMGTPNKRNHFYRLDLQAKNNDDGRWASFAFPSTENPHLSQAALAELSQDMTAEDYRQEILGEFVEGEGQVFRVRDTHFWKPNGGHADHPKGTTIDWGQVQDYTSISVGCLQCHKELELIRFRGMSYPDQLQRIKELYQRVGGSIWAEANSMGLPNIQQLQADGVPVMPFDTTLQSKRQIIQGLRLALERDEWQFVEDMVARLELEAYEATTSPRTGQTTYQAAEGAHDDTVISRALLVWADAQGHITLG